MAETEEFDRFRYSAGLQDAAVTRDFSLVPREDRWGYAAQDRAFVDAIAGEESFGANAEDGLEAVRIVAACYESASTHRAVTLDGQRRTR
jgi:predicted dehydrogenase